MLIQSKTHSADTIRKFYNHSLILFSILLLIGTATPVWACYAVVAGKNATVDGSVMVAHNEQNGGRRVLNFRRIPRLQYQEGATLQLRRGGELAQVRETNAFFWSENPGLEFSDAYCNEYGVAVVSDGCGTREDSYDTLVKRGEIRDGGIGYMLRRLIVQRAKSAKEGVQIAGRLVEQFGYADSGRSYVVADSNEAWLLAVVRGRRWAAQRVPDDAVVLLPNVHIIGEMDLNDSDNFLASPDLISYAIERGWFDPNDGEPFSFRKVYRAQRNDPPDPRQYRGQCIVMDRPLSPLPKESLPFAVKPPRKLGINDLLKVLRDRESPSICTTTTQEAAVFQLRKDLPKEIGCVYWRTTAEPSTSVLTPWYIGITETPDTYYLPSAVETQLSLDHHFSPPPNTFTLDNTKAWWKFRTLQTLVHEDYETRIKTIRPIWDAYEKELFDKQQKIEKQALNQFQTDPAKARAFLTKYCADIAQQACGKADELIQELEKGNQAAVKIQDTIQQH